MVSWNINKQYNRLKINSMIPSLRIVPNGQLLSVTGLIYSYLNLLAGLTITNMFDNESYSIQVNGINKHILENTSELVAS